MRRLGLGLVALLVVAATASPTVAQRSWDGGNATFVWGDNGNWSPDGSPNGVAISIGNLLAAANDTTLLDAAYSISSLTITNGADVVNSTDSGATNDFLLTVNGLTSISDAGSSIVIYGGDLNGLDTDTLTINSGASLILNSTTPQGTAIVEVDNGLFDLNAGGTVTGTGRVDLDDVLAAPTTLLINDGSIIANTPTFLIFQAPAAGTLQIASADADARFDWDGGGTGILQANGNQTLDIDVQPGSGAIADPFSGTMNLATGSAIDIAHAWSMDSGTINANTAAFGLIIIGQDPSPGAGATIRGADWTMTGGTINVDDTWDTLILESNVNATGGLISVAGVLRINGAATFAAGSNLSPTGSSPGLIVDGSATVGQAAFNWDGFVTTTVNDGATLTISSASIDTAGDGYDGTLSVNGGTVTVTNAWLLEAATVNLSTSASDSDLSGGTITVNSPAAQINVIGSGAADADINATLVIDAALDVNIAAGATLDLNTNTVNVLGTTWDGGAGSVLRNGAATINAVTTYNLPGGVVDFDDGADTLNAQLTINADAIDTAVGDGYDGTLTINNSGALIVNLTGNAAWRLDSVLTYNGDATSGTIVGGSSPVEFRASSTLNVNGEGAIISRATLAGTVNVNSAGEDVELLGGDQTVGNTNLIDGATVNGPGVLAVDDGQALRGNGTINAPFRGDGSAQLIAEGGMLTLNGAIQDVGTIGTSGPTAVLNVTNPWNTNVADLVVLDEGLIQGAAITNDGAGIRGRGAITALINNNSSMVSTTPGTLRIANAANDWDGAANTGVLRATQGVLELNDNASFLFSGTVQADSGVVFANGFELEFEPASTLILSGGRYRSTNATDLGGAVIVVAGNPGALQIAGTTVFEATSNVTLGDDLKLENSATRIDSGATFSGGGALVNVPGSLLRLSDGANVGVLVDNQGSLQLGAAAGAAQTTGLDFQQSAGGLLNIDLGGLGAAQSDRMSLTGVATLTGGLDISLMGGYVPALGDAITILAATGGVSGSFTSVSEPAGLPAGTLFDVVYQPTFVQLVLKSAPLYSADFDLDGDVDADDLVVWNGSFGINDGADADNDGDSDGADFLAWQQQLGSVPAVAAAQGVPEPGSLVLAAGALGFAVGRRRRHPH